MEKEETYQSPMPISCKSATGEEKTDQALTPLSFSSNSLEEVISEIDDVLKQIIAYSQEKLRIFDEIYTLQRSNKSNEAKKEFTRICGDFLIAAEPRAFLGQLLSIKESHTNVIHNATTFRADLYENIGGSFKRPRDAIGAAQISISANVEITDIQNELEGRKNPHVINEVGMAPYFSEVYGDIIGFYNQVKEGLNPFWSEEAERDGAIFGDKIKKHMAAYGKLKEDSEKEKKKREGNKKKAGKKKATQPTPPSHKRNKHKKGKGGKRKTTPVSSRTSPGKKEKEEAFLPQKEAEHETESSETKLVEKNSSLEQTGPIELPPLSPPTTFKSRK